MAGNRDATKVRFDLLIPEFLRLMAEAMHEGHEKYDDERPFPNWQYGLEEGKAPINHAYDHLVEYHELRNCDDHWVEDANLHLAHLACNAMMQYWLDNNELRIEDAPEAADLEPVPTASTFVEPPPVPTQETSNILELLKAKLGEVTTTLVTR